MKRFLLFAITLLPLLYACGGKEKADPQKPGGKDPDPGGNTQTGLTTAQRETVANFVTLAVAGDDYCESLSNEGGKFAMQTFSGKRCSIDAELPILAEGAAAADLKDYVVDGQRFAVFHLGGETISLPSDIHQWYNPPLPRNCEHLSVLFTGNAFCDDATVQLPGMLDAAETAIVEAGRAIREGACLADWNANFSTAAWCSYGLWTAEEEDWPIIISPNSSLEDAIKARDWDVITIMEDSVSEAGWNFDQTAETNLNSLLDKIFRTCTTKRPTVMLMLAPALPSSHELVVDHFNGESDKMFEALAAYGKAVTDRTSIFDIVSVCAAEQNLRTSTLNFTSTNSLTRDGVRLDCGVGCFTAAGTVFCKIIEPCTGLKFEENTYVYELSSTEEGQIATAVSPVALPLCRYAAVNAAAYPLKITDLAALSPDINTGGIPDVGGDKYPEIL